MLKRSIIAIGTGLAVFIAGIFISRLAVQDAFGRQVLLKLSIAVLSLVIATGIFRLPWSTFRIKGGNRKITTRYVLRGATLGALASTLVLLIGLPPIPLLKQLSFGKYILAIWFVSSICEEILVRGLVQGIVQQKEIQPGGSSKIPYSVWVGAIVFSLMHLSIYLTGGNIFTCIIIMAFALFLGLLAGLAKTKGSLLSAIYVHIAFNIGGFLGGAIVNITAKITTGHFLVH